MHATYIVREWHSKHKCHPHNKSTKLQWYCCVFVNATKTKYLFGIKLLTCQVNPNSYNKGCLWKCIGNAFDFVKCLNILLICTEH